MDEGSSKHPSKPLLKLFQEAWKELRAESDESDITTIQIKTGDDERKNVNGFEFWQKMIEEVERQKDDPDYLIYSPIDEEKIEDLFMTTILPQPGEEPAFYRNGKYYIPRISNLYLQNLNLGYDQWFIAQDIRPNPRILKIVRRKHYVSPSSTNEEIMIELIYARELSEKMNKERLANKKKEAEEKKAEVKKDSENMEVNIIHEKLEMKEFKNPETTKATEKDNSKIIKKDAMVQTEVQQCNIADIENRQSTLLEQERTVQTIERYRNRADELEKQLQVLEKGHIYLEDVIEIENPKKTKRMSRREKFDASSRIDLSSYAEEGDEVPEKMEETYEQKEFGTSYFFDLASCIEDVPEQTEQLSYERESEDSYSTDLDEESDVPAENTTDVQVEPNLFEDTAWRDLRPNIATQNVNPQNLGINMNYPSPHIPVMNRPNYGRVPFFTQPRSFRRPVYPYKFCNPYYGHGPRNFVRNPFPFRPQPPFIPLPTHRVPRLFPQHPFPPMEAPLPRHMPPRLLFPYIPLIPSPALARPRIYHETVLNSGFPFPGHQTQRISYGDSAERNQQSVPYPSINLPSQWSEPVIIYGPNTIPNYDPENFQLAHEQPRTQIAPDNNLHFINDVPAHLSRISTTLASRERVVQEVSKKSSWEYIVIIKKKSGQTQLTAQAPLSSIIPIPDDDIEDGNQNDIQSGKCVKFENTSMAAAKLKKSSLRRHNVKRNQRRRTVHFSRSVIERDEMKNKNLNQKSKDKSNNQPGSEMVEDEERLQREQEAQQIVSSSAGREAVDERVYLRTPSIFEILNSRKDADPNEPQKVPTNYMEDVIQRKERRWKSMDQVPGSPSLDLILDMIRKDNEMLEDEERLQREQQAQQIVSSSAGREADYEKFESIHHNEFIEMYPYEAYDGAEGLVENTPEITLELPEITNEPESSMEITVSNSSDAGVILNANPENVTVVVVHAVQEPQSPKGAIGLSPPDRVDILNLSPVTQLEHAFQDFSGFEEILDEKNDVLQLAVDGDPSKDISNLRECEDVVYKSDEAVSLSACDEIEQMVETIRVLPSADIQAIQDYSSTNQPLKTGTTIHMVGNLKIEIDEEETALLNNLTTSNERLSLGVLLPDSAVLKLKEKLFDKWSKTHQSVDGVSRENLAAIISPDQTLIKKPEKSSFPFSDKSQTSTNASYSQANTNWWKTSNRQTSFSLENLGGNLDQISIKKPEKSSSMSLEKSQTSSNEIHIKNWWKPKIRETSVSAEELGATSRLDQTPIMKPEKSSSLFPEKSGNESLALANKNWWKTKKLEHSVSLENLGATSTLDQISTEKIEKSSSFSSKRSQISSDNDSAQANKYWWKTAKRDTNVSLENLGGNLDEALNNKTDKTYSLSPKNSQSSICESQDLPINKIMRSSEESSSELATDENRTCQLLVTRDQATQTIDIDDSDDNLDVAVEVKDESTQTDEEIKNILSYADVVRKNKRN